MSHADAITVPILMSPQLRDAMIRSEGSQDIIPMRLIPHEGGFELVVRSANRWAAFTDDELDALYVSDDYPADLRRDLDSEIIAELERRKA